MYRVLVMVLSLAVTIFCRRPGTDGSFTPIRGGAISKKLVFFSANTELALTVS